MCEGKKFKALTKKSRGGQKGMCVCEGKTFKGWPKRHVSASGSAPRREETKTKEPVVRHAYKYREAAMDMEMLHT